MRTGSTPVIRARPKVPSVVMPACGPVRLIAVDAAFVERHDQQRGADQLARREQQVELARVGPASHLGRQGEQLVGAIAHGRHDDDALRAVGMLLGETAGDRADVLRCLQARAAVLGHDRGRGDGR